MQTYFSIVKLFLSDHTVDPPIRKETTLTWLLKILKPINFSFFSMTHTLSGCERMPGHCLQQKEAFSIGPAAVSLRLYDPARLDNTCAICCRKDSFQSFRSVNKLSHTHSPREIKERLSQFLQIDHQSFYLFFCKC